MDRVTFVTSSGLVWLALAVHFGAGLVSIVAGAIALSVAKGGRLHKQSGLVFTWSMIVLGLTAAGIGMYENRPSQVFAGLIAAYFAFTALTTGKPLPGIGQGINVVLMVLAFAYALSGLYGGVTEWLDPTVKVVGRRACCAAAGFRNRHSARGDRRPSRDSRRRLAWIATTGAASVADVLRALHR